MAKAASLAEILNGPRIREVMSVPAINGTKLEFALRVLMPHDCAAIERDAVAFAEGYGVKNPQPGNTQYERGLAVHTCALACLDHEVTERDEPFFRDTKEVMAFLDDARLQWVFMHQRAMQQRLSPNPMGEDPLRFLNLVFASMAEAEAKGDPSRPFVGLPYGTLVSFSTQAANMLFPLLRLQSPSGSEKADDTRSSASSSPS